MLLAWPEEAVWRRQRGAIGEMQGGPILEPSRPRPFGLVLWLRVHADPDDNRPSTIAIVTCDQHATRLRGPRASKDQPEPGQKLLAWLGSHNQPPCLEGVSLDDGLPVGADQS